MNKKHLMIVVTSIMVTVLSGCTKSNQSQILVVGSSSMQPMIEEAANKFQTTNKDMIVNVQGGGSGTGLAQVQEGAVQIGNSDVFAEEKKGIHANKLDDNIIAAVGVTPIVNKNVKANDLSLKQLQKIFSGEINNWKEIDGTDLPIVIINRATGSGTRMVFEKDVMKEFPTKQAQEQDSTGMVRKIVAATPGAISYVAFPYVTSDVKTVSVDGIKPINKNVLNNDWKIWSYEHMYTKGKSDKKTEVFINYVKSDDVQGTIVHDLGYIPINEMKVAKDYKGNVKVITKERDNNG